MKNSRLALHRKLEEILGNKNVYFQAPSTLKYPCIVYELEEVPEKHADDKKYIRNYRYRMTLIHKDPDNPIIDRLLELKYCSFDKSFTTQGLHHYVFTIYIKDEKEII